MQNISRAERAELHASVRGFFDRCSSESEVRRLLDDELGYDPAVWSRLSDQLALPGLLIPDSLGGQGFSPAEAVLGLEEAGRRLSGVPLLSSSVMATWALLQADDPEAAGPLLTALAQGTSIAALALDGTPGRPPRATRGDDGWLLTGVATNVVGGHLADLLLVVALVEGHANGGSTIGLFAVPAEAEGVSVEMLPTLDLTRALSRITLAGVRSRRVGEDFGAGLASAVSLATVGACAELPSPPPGAERHTVNLIAPRP